MDELLISGMGKNWSAYCQQADVAAGLTALPGALEAQVIAKFADSKRMPLATPQSVHNLKEIF